MTQCGCQVTKGPVEGQEAALTAPGREWNGVRIVSWVLFLVVAVFIAFIGLSSGFEYIHIGSLGCVYEHTGFRNLHASCGSNQDDLSDSDAPGIPTALQSGLVQGLTSPTTAPVVPQTSEPTEEPTVTLPVGMPKSFIMPSSLTLTSAVSVGTGPNLQLAYTWAGMTVDQASTGINQSLTSRGWRMEQVGAALDSVVESVTGFGWTGSITVSGAFGPQVEVNLNPTA